MHANFAIVAPSDRLNVAPEDVERRFNSERRPVPAGPADERLRTLEQQREAFRLLSQRIKSLGNDVRLNLPELTSLHRRATLALDTSKLLFRELDRAESSDGTEVPAATLADVLDVNSRQLDVIEQQLWLVESLKTIAPALLECVHELQRNTTCPVGRVQQLARRILLDVDRSSEARFLRLDEGLSLSAILARHAELNQPAIYASSIEAARLVAWMSGELQMVSTRRELVIIAALLQDVGLLNQLRLKGASLEELIRTKPDVFREHPAMSAALVAGVREHQVELPTLVAQHHERLDGTGYPRRLVARRVMYESRVLSVVARFLELAGRCGLNLPETEAVARIRLSPLHAAVIQLHREAEQGEFDLTLATNLVKALGFEFQDTKRFEPGFLRVDGAHGLGSGPHFRELERDKVRAPHFHRARARRRRQFGEKQQ